MAPAWIPCRHYQTQNVLCHRFSVYYTTLLQLLLYQLLAILFLIQIVSMVNPYFIKKAITFQHTITGSTGSISNTLPHQVSLATYQQPTLPPTMGNNDINTVFQHPSLTVIDYAVNDDDDECNNSEWNDAFDALDSILNNVTIYRNGCISNTLTNDQTGNNGMNNMVSINTIPRATGSISNTLSSNQTGNIGMNNMVSTNTIPRATGSISNTLSSDQTNNIGINNMVLISTIPRAVVNHYVTKPTANTKQTPR